MKGCWGCRDADEWHPLTPRCQGGVLKNSRDQRPRSSVAWTCSEALERARRRFPPDGALEEVEEERRLPVEREWLALKADDFHEVLGPRIVASWARESDADCSDELLEVTPGTAVVEALQAPRRGAAAAAAAAAAAPDDVHTLGCRAEGRRAAVVDDEGLEAELELLAQREGLPVRGVEDDADDVLEEEEMEALHLLRLQRTSRQV